MTGGVAMRIGVIGYGSAGRRHVRNLLARGESMNIVAYDAFLREDDVNIEQSLGHGASMESCDRLGDFLDCTPYDAVIIATPARFHTRYLRLMGELRIPSLVEKPLTDAAGLPELERAFKARRELFKGPPYRVGYNWLWHLGVEAMRQAIPRPTEIDVSLETNMAMWPGRDYASPIFECSHELAVLDDWIGALTLEACGSGWALGRAVSSGCRWYFSWRDRAPNDATHGRTWVVRGQDGSRRVFAFSPDSEETAESYRRMLDEFLVVVRDRKPRKPRLLEPRNGITAGLRIARLCAEIERRERENQSS